MHSYEDDILFLRKSKSEGEIIGNNADTVLNDFYGSGKQKYLNNVWRNISLDSSDDAIVILQNTKKTTCDVPGCVAGANKSQTTYENIYHSSWFNSASLYRVFCLGIYLFFSFLETIIWIKQSHVLNG